MTCAMLIAPFMSGTISRSLTRRQIDNFLLNLIYDDGFVAYLNGTEVARFNIDWHASAVHAITGSSGGFETGDPSTFDLTSYKNLLVNGTNTLAIQLINASLGG